MISDDEEDIIEFKDDEKFDKKFQKSYSFIEELKEFKKYLIDLNMKYFDFATCGHYFDANLIYEDEIENIFGLFNDNEKHELIKEIILNDKNIDIVLEKLNNVN